MHSKKIAVSPSTKIASGVSISGFPYLKEKITLYDSQKRPIAIMLVTDKFKYSKDLFCKGVFKTVDESHPGVKALKGSPNVFLAGPVQLLQRPHRGGIEQKYCVDPIETRLEFKRRGWETVVAFQTRNPLHRAHEFLINAALKAVNGALIHPLVGETKADDVPAEIRMKCYEALMAKYFPLSKVMLSVLLTSMHYAGPREALQHAIIRRNFGCTHFIVGRDHAGVGNFYGHYEAQELLIVYASHIGIKPIIFNNVFFCRKCANYTTAEECFHLTKEHVHLSGTKIREMLKLGIRPPLEFSRAEVVDILMNWAKNKKRTIK